VPGTRGNAKHEGQVHQLLRGARGLGVPVGPVLDARAQIIARIISATRRQSLFCLGHFLALNLLHNKFGYLGRLTFWGSKNGGTLTSLTESSERSSRIKYKNGL
jgi:hypothetical protein